MTSIGELLCLDMTLTSIWAKVIRRGNTINPEVYQVPVHRTVECPVWLVVWHTGHT
jgi:hypothetical protein